jgi:hypothetical protein
MSLTDPPDIITLVDAKLQACASYPSGVATWYPEAPEGTTADHIVLVDANDDLQAYAEGCAPIGSGEIAVLIYADMTAGALKQLARDLIKEAITLPTGIRLRSGGAPVATRAGHAKRVSGHNLNVIQITFQYGLQA